MENVEIKETKKQPKLINAEAERKKKAKKKASKKVAKVEDKDKAKVEALIAFMKGCNERRKKASLPDAYTEEEIKAEEDKL
jgi:hypothetical protein